MALKKFFKKSFSKVKKLAKKRYASKSGGVKMSQLIRDVALVKRSLNVEKKNVEFIELNNIAFGQFNGLTDTGQVITDVTPVLAQGVGYNERTGNSVKLVSMCIKGQIKQQTATRHPMRIKISLFKVIGSPIPIATIQSQQQIWQPNPITNTTDYNSDRNINFFRSFVHVQTKYLYLQPDPVSGELMIINFKFIMKMNHHLKWNLNSQDLTDGQMVMYILADSGNASTVTTGVNPNVPILATNTGAILQTYSKFFYVDN